MAGTGLTGIPAARSTARVSAIEATVFTSTTRRAGVVGVSAV
jgi:hypothetical protein